MVMYIDKLGFFCEELGFMIVLDYLFGLLEYEYVIVFFLNNYVVYLSVVED